MRAACVTSGPQHTTLDAFALYRAPCDDIRLVNELLEELPSELGLTPVMPPFLLPYYGGVVPEDSGISAFVLLPAGHITLHTFSKRGCYFADVVSQSPFDADHFVSVIESALPTRKVHSTTVTRRSSGTQDRPCDPDNSFGPHLMFDLKGYSGPRQIDSLFALFDRLPNLVSMTPIMRPYVLRSCDADGTAMVSAVTMIAESHVSLHLRPDDGLAWFDLFSCRPFDATQVVDRLTALLPAQAAHSQVVMRGRGYITTRDKSVPLAFRQPEWLRSRLRDAGDPE